MYNIKEKAQKNVYQIMYEIYALVLVLSRTT